MKKLKIYVLALFFFSFLKINAGCGVRFWMTLVGENKQYPISQAGYGSATYFALDTTQFFYFFAQGTSCSFKMSSFKFNGSPISFTQAAKCRPGLYEAEGILNSHLPAACVFYITNGLEVGVTEYTNTNQWLTLFPNPSKESVTINSFEENLKTVAIYNVNSELIEFIETESKTLTIPLSQYPQGIYIVKVATLSNKIVIKKLIVSN